MPVIMGKQLILNGVDVSEWFAPETCIVSTNPNAIEFGFYEPETHSEIWRDLFAMKPGQKVTLFYKYEGNFYLHSSPETAGRVIVDTVAEFESITLVHDHGQLSKGKLKFLLPDYQFFGETINATADA